MIWIWLALLAYTWATLYKWSIPNNWFDFRLPWDPRNGHPRTGKAEPDHHDDEPSA